MKNLWNTDFIYNNNLDKACFQHDMAYDKYKNLNERRHLDKVVGELLKLQVIQNVAVIKKD